MKKIAIFQITAKHKTKKQHFWDKENDIILNRSFIFFTCSPGRLLTPFPICVSSQSSCSSSSVPDRLPSLPPLLHHARKTDNITSLAFVSCIYFFLLRQELLKKCLYFIMFTEAQFSIFCCLRISNLCNHVFCILLPPSNQAKLVSIKFVTFVLLIYGLCCFLFKNINRGFHRYLNVKGYCMCA